MKKIKGVLLDTETQSISVIELDDKLEAFYAALHCSLIEAVTRSIGGQNFTIVCDEEGTFANDPKISAANLLGNVMFVGSLFICQTNGENFSGVTDEEANYIMKHCRTLQTQKHPEGLCMLYPVEYPEYS